MVVGWEHTQQNVYSERRIDGISSIQRKYDFKNFPAESELELAYLVHIFSILNQLNVQLQVKGANLFTHQGIIKAFVEKLQIWINRVENSNFVQFPYLNVTVGDKQDIQVHVLEHLQS